MFKWRALTNTAVCVLVVLGASLTTACASTTSPNRWEVLGGANHPRLEVSVHLDSPRVLAGLPCWLIVEVRNSSQQGDELVFMPPVLRWEVIEPGLVRPQEWFDVEGSQGTLGLVIKPEVLAPGESCARRVLLTRHLRFARAGKAGLYLDVGVPHEPMAAERDSPGPESILGGEAEHFRVVVPLEVHCPSPAERNEVLSRLRTTIRGISGRASREQLGASEAYCSCAGPTFGEEDVDTLVWMTSQADEYVRLYGLRGLASVPGDRVLEPARRLAVEGDPAIVATAFRVLERRRILLTEAEVGRMLPQCGGEQEFHVVQYLVEVQHPQCRELLELVQRRCWSGMPAHWAREWLDSLR